MNCVSEWKIAQRHGDAEEKEDEPENRILHFSCFLRFRVSARFSTLPTSAVDVVTIARLLTQNQAMAMQLQRASSF